jgi:hypothetical protein
MERISNIINCIWQTTEQREFNEKVRQAGLKIAIENSLNEIHKNISSKEIAMKFILQELELAHQENTLPQEFISNSGFHPLEYENTLNRFKESETELLKPQNIFDTLLRNIQKEKDVTHASIKIIEDVMSKWQLGKYSKVKEEKKKEINTKEKINKEVEETVTTETPITPQAKNQEAKKEKIPQPILYDNKRVNHLMEEYSDIIGDIITGNPNEKEAKRIEEFKKHISQASIEGESSHAIVLSCFYEHQEPYNAMLPIKATEMNQASLSFLQNILKGFAQQGFSDTFLAYEKENKEGIY